MAVNPAAVGEHTEMDNAEMLTAMNIGVRTATFITPPPDVVGESDRPPGSTRRALCERETPRCEPRILTFPVLQRLLACDPVNVQDGIVMGVQPRACDGELR